MKLKRFVAIVISLAMVLSIVPAFSLTASAAEAPASNAFTVELLEQMVTDATNVIDYSGNHGYSDSDLNANWGWTPKYQYQLRANLRTYDGHDTLQIYNGENNAVWYVGRNIITSSDVQEKTANKDYFVIDFLTHYSAGLPGNFTMTFYSGTAADANGYDAPGGSSEFLKFQYGKDGIVPSTAVNQNADEWGTSITGAQADYVPVRAYVAKNAEGTYDVIWTVKNADTGVYEIKHTVTGMDASRAQNGFKTLRTYFTFNNWQHVGFSDLKIYSGNYADIGNVQEVTVTYTVNGNTVKTETKKYNVAEEAGASFDEVYYASNGSSEMYYAAAQTLSDSTTIAMTKVDNWAEYPVGTEFVNNGTPYKVVGANIIPNGNFEHGINGWYSGDNSAASSSNFSVADNVLTQKTGGYSSSAQSIYRAWPIEGGKTYAAVWTMGADSANAYWKTATGATRETGVITQLCGTMSAGTTVLVFTAEDTAAYATFNVGWYSGTMSNFGLYEVEVDSSKIANTTIEFEDANGTTLKDSVTITGVVGDTIDLTDTSIVPETITYNSNLYAKNDSRTSYTVAGNNDVVTITYETSAVTSFEAIAVTVIAGNDPILPATVTGVTGNGSRNEGMAVTWASHTGLSAGTHTITGTVEGANVNATATVTVLSETFSLADTDVPASSDTTLSFPENISGEFVMEFDYTPSSVQNNWIYISADGALWGAGQIGIGTNDDTTGTLKAQPSTVLGTVESGKTYRMLVTGNASTDTYSIVVTHEDGTTWKADSTFRSNSDYINSIRMLPNGDKGSFAVKNIKVYNANSALKTITINATGSVSETTTVKAASAEVAPIPHYDGHIMNTRTISGNTVTVKYEATTDSLGSWAIRNNITDEDWLTETKFIGSHNAFASTETAIVSEGGALYGDTGASTTIGLGKSRTQSANAWGQLNAGVRYFDVRLTRQEDGSFYAHHGPAFENFRTVAITIAQFAKEHPGELIIIDFSQEMYDAQYTSDKVITDNDTLYGPDPGDDNKEFYAALRKMLDETGVLEYALPAAADSAPWDKKYGELTNYGEKTGILILCKDRGANCEPDVFVKRSKYTQPGHNTTYLESSSYSSVVSNIDDTYGSLSSGINFGIIHAYTTPGIISTATILAQAEDNNPNWQTATNFAAWMGSGKGDILMLNDAVTGTTGLRDKLYEFNRDDFDGIYTKTVNEVTMTGPTASVPFSTKFVAEPTESTATYTIDGVTYTAVRNYDIDLLQYNKNSVALNGNVTVTFPKISTDTTTVDVLLSSDGTTVYQTAAVGEAISINTTALADVILATRVAPGKEYTVTYVDGDTTIYTVTEMVPYGQVVYSVPAGDFYLEATDKAYILNSATAQSHTAAAEDTVTEFTVNVTVVSENAVLGDTFANNDGSADCNNTENLLFVGSSGISDPGDSDADAAAMVNNGGNVGSPRIPVLTFNVPEVTDGKAVKLNLYVAKANQNLEHGSMKLAVGTADIVVDEAQGYVASSVANTTNVIWSDQMFTAVGDQTDGRREVNSWVTVDVTEFVKAATGDTITFTLYAPTAGAYVADREKAVAGGTYEGKAAYMEVVDAYTVEVTGASKITRNGNLVDATDSVVAYEGAQIKLYETSADTPAFTNGTKVYATDNTTGATGYITVTGSDEYYAATVGVAPVDGAQVRIGDGVNENGKVDGTNSGLRFITTVDYTDSLANVEGATFGVEITAEGSSAEPVKIVANQFQDDAKTVFTSALTNLAVGNFNRKFTATPYVIADGQTFYGTPVTRSIYQVAAGLLTNDMVDEDNTQYGEGALAAKSMIDVLNAYVNQTGIRLSVTSAGLTAYTGTGTSAYSGDQFFEVVSSETVSENVYAITIKPAGSKTTINDYWQEYIRINNNNSKISAYTSMVDNGDGSVTITFDYASYLAENAQ